MIPTLLAARIDGPLPLTVLFYTGKLINEHPFFFLITGLVAMVVLQFRPAQFFQRNKSLRFWLVLFSLNLVVISAGAILLKLIG